MFQGSLNFTDFTFEHPVYACDGSFALSWAGSFDHILLIIANIFTFKMVRMDKLLRLIHPNICKEFSMNTSFITELVKLL